MQSLFKDEHEINLDSVIMRYNNADEELKTFRRKHKIPVYPVDEIVDVITDISVHSTDEHFDFAFRFLLHSAFSRFTLNQVFDINDMVERNDAHYHPYILAKTKGILKVHDIIYDKIHEPDRDQITSAATVINEDDEYIRTQSQVLNSYIGGFSTGYVGTIGAKSSHGKSSWVDANAVQNILTGKVQRVDIVTPEESAESRWRRIFAMICKIPTSSMRQKNIQITDDHIKRVKEALEGKLVIHDDVTTMKQTIELCGDVSGQMIYIDHLQALIYPGRGSALQNMIGNIPGLLNAQKGIAKRKKNVIINVSQVNDKDIQRSERITKAPRYWDLYGSSVLLQAARELLMLWYPWKDMEESSYIMGHMNYTINDFIVSVEKSSFGRTGKVMQNFNPEFNTFIDKNPDAITSLANKAPGEQNIDQLAMELK